MTILSENFFIEFGWVSEGLHQKGRTLVLLNSQSPSLFPLINFLFLPDCLAHSLFLCTGFTPPNGGAEPLMSLPPPPSDGPHSIKAWAPSGPTPPPHTPNQPETAQEGKVFAIPTHTQSTVLFSGWIQAFIPLSSTWSQVSNFCCILTTVSFTDLQTSSDSLLSDKWWMKYILLGFQ